MTSKPEPIAMMKVLVLAMALSIICVQHAYSGMVLFDLFDEKPARYVPKSLLHKSGPGGTYIHHLGGPFFVFPEDEPSRCVPDNVCELKFVKANDAKADPLFSIRGSGKYLFATFFVPHLDGLTYYSFVFCSADNLQLEISFSATAGIRLALPDQSKRSKWC